MTSSFGWLDHSEHQRQQMLEIVGLFRERGTLDELGIGTIRDAYADHFFPGTSTLHTRLRYVLFIPWILEHLEQKRVASARFDGRAREYQSWLVAALLKGGESQGVIGVSARGALIRPPSVIYWTAMRALGILRYPYSYDRYVRSLDSHYADGRGALRSDDGELVEVTASVFHGALPDRPGGIWDAVSFDLEPREADYLQERIITHQQRTLMAAYATNGAPVEAIDYPWNHPIVSELPEDVRQHLREAERFSLVIQGAYLLYNLMLSEAAVDGGMTAREGYPERYMKLLDEWSANMTAETDLFAGWSSMELWESLARIGRTVPLRTRQFIDHWSRLALVNHVRIGDDTAARELISEREHALKRGLARLHSRRALENWGGESSIGRLDFRWRVARQFISDIKAGQQRAASGTPDA